MEKDLEANINRIKKVTTSSSMYRVNSLLNEGWKIIEIQKTNYGHPQGSSDRVIYHLGHVDPKANGHERDENKIIYTRPEDL